MKLLLRTSFVVLAIWLGLTSMVSAQSLSLDDAKGRGYVGEQLDGYLGVVANASGVQTLVESINLQRRQLYRDVARKNGIPLSTVEKLAGQKAINRAGAGEYVQNTNGQWVRKP